MTKSNLPPHQVSGHVSTNCVALMSPSKIWFATDFKSSRDLEKINPDDTVRHGDFVVRVISIFIDPQTGDTLIIGIQESYSSPYWTSFKDRIIWSRSGISSSVADYQIGNFIKRKIDGP